MSKKLNKQKAKKQNKSTITEIERQLLKSHFPMECESLPIEKLTEKEQNIVQKCINHDNIDDDEFILLKKLLQQYRKAINEFKPKEVKEAYDNAITLINTEQDLLDILDNESNKYIKVNLPYNNKIYSMEFKIAPLNDSRAVESLQMQTDIFKDYTIDDKVAYNKSVNGHELTKEEQLIVDKIQKDLEDKASKHQDEIVCTILANQLTMSNSTMDIEKRKEFWRKFPFNSKFSIFMKVQDRLGLTDVKNEELFPT